MEKANSFLEEKCSTLLAEIERLERGIAELMAVKLRLEEAEVEGGQKILEVRLGNLHI